MERPIMHPKCTKRLKHAKKKPLKVVYISNPIKFVTTADEFRTLVQQLTGRQSNIVDGAEAMGFLTTSTDQIYQRECGPNITGSSDGYRCEGFADEDNMFGDLSSICHESLRYQTHGHGCVEGGFGYYDGI